MPPLLKHVKVFQTLFGHGRYQFHTSACHMISKKNPATKTNKVVVSKDGSMVFCWHPEPDYPYEHTRPMPRDEKEARMGDSVLKIKMPDEYLAAHKVQGPTQRQLGTIFNQPFQHFRHKPYLRKLLYHRRKPPAPEREGI